MQLSICGSYADATDRAVFSAAVNNIMNSKEKDGFFLSYSKSNSINTWNENYWERPRLLPKLIFGKKMSSEQLFPRWINIDWHPAKEPYDIPGMS